MWPATLLLLFRWGRQSGGVFRIRILLGIVTAASFVLSLALTDVNQPWAFYLLPTRIWQLGIGALLALDEGSLCKVRASLGASLTGLGIGIALGASILLSENSVFPGFAAILPVAAAALVIVGGMPVGGTSATRWLGAPPLRFLGSISYSVYLWHWPLLVLAAAYVGHPLSTRTACVIVAASIPLAAMTQRLVEAPLRRDRSSGPGLAGTSVRQPS